MKRREVLSDDFPVRIRRKGRQAVLQVIISSGIAAAVKEVERQTCCDVVVLERHSEDKRVWRYGIYTFEPKQ